MYMCAEVYISTRLHNTIYTFLPMYIIGSDGVSIYIHWMYMCFSILSMVFVLMGPCVP